MSTNKTRYSSLHTHTMYSVLDGTIKIPELISRVKELGMTSVALTDHGNLHGVMEFYKECKKKEVKPLIGVELYTTYDKDGIDNSKKTKDNYHLVVIAKNQTGYKNLLWLVSNANANNFYYKPRVSFEQLKKRRSGLVGLSACLGGLLSKSMDWDEEKQTIDITEETEDSLGLLTDIFEDDFYLEIQDHDNWEQEAYNKNIIRLADDYHIPLVITTDAHYLTKEDKDAHKLAMAHQMGMTLKDYLEGKKMIYTGEFHIKSEEEINVSLEKYGRPEILDNIQKVVDKCNVEIEIGKLYMPTFDIQNQSDYQEFLAWQKT